VINSQMAKLVFIHALLSRAYLSFS